MKNKTPIKAGSGTNRKKFSYHAFQLHFLQVNLSFNFLFALNSSTIIAKGVSFNTLSAFLEILEDCSNPFKLIILRRVTFRKTRRH